MTTTKVIAQAIEDQPIPIATWDGLLAEFNNVYGQWQAAMDIDDSSEDSGRLGHQHERLLIQIATTRPPTLAGVEQKARMLSESEDGHGVPDDVDVAAEISADLAHLAVGSEKLAAEEGRALAEVILAEAAKQQPVVPLPALDFRPSRSRRKAPLTVQDHIARYDQARQGVWALHWTWRHRDLDAVEACLLRDQILAQDRAFTSVCRMAEEASAPASAPPASQALAIAAPAVSKTSSFAATLAAWHKARAEHEAAIDVYSAAEARVMAKEIGPDDPVYTKADAAALSRRLVTVDWMIKRMSP